MPTATRKQAKPALEGYSDVVPSLAEVRSPLEAARLLPFEAFSDPAAGYLMDLIETWCSRQSSEAQHELRFILEQAKWAVGYKAGVKLFLDLLPEAK